MAVCCMAEKYGNWCKDEKTVEIDGEHYCIFHAPLHQKDLFRKQFDEDCAEQIHLRIEEAGGKNGNDTLKFDGSIFPVDMDFGRYCEKNPLPSISFRSTQFTGHTDFRYTYFGGVTDFRAVTFLGDTSFNDAHFVDDVYIFSTDFSGFVDFRSSFFSADLCINYVKFNGSVYFSYIEFSGCVSISSVSFVEKVYFIDSKFKDMARFARVSTNSPLLFQKIDADSMGNVQLTSLNIECFKFNQCNWPDKLYGEDHYNPERSDYIGLAELYRSLKQRALEEHDQTMVSKWHFREKEMQRKQGFWKNFVLQLYWLFCGYGERPLWAFGWLAFFLLTPFVGYFFFTGADFNVSLENALRHVPFTKMPRIDGGYDALDYARMTIWQLIITIQATLFGFALRNKFRR